MHQYKIGDKTYIQDRLVLGQIQQLIGLSREIKFPSEFTRREIIPMLGERLPEALAIILTEEGKSLRGKDLKALAEEISYSIDLETTAEVIDHFFELNSIRLILERFSGISIKITEKLKTGLKIGSRTPSSSSQEETSPSETKFSGVSPAEIVSPFLDIESET